MVFKGLETGMHESKMPRSHFQKKIYKWTNNLCCHNSCNKWSDV